MSLNPLAYKNLVEQALMEDIGRGIDVTSQSLVTPNKEIKAQIVARQDATVAGTDVALHCFQALDQSISFKRYIEDGRSVKPGDIISDITGPAHSVVAGERTALNFLSHLSGIATKTAEYVAQTKGTKASIAATRKTLPGLRALQKYAVLMGGGQTHRYGLDDGILIKDNHIMANDGDVTKTLNTVLQNKGHMTKLEIEVDTLDQLQEIIESSLKVDIVLLDNMSASDLVKAVEISDGQFVLEASGGITLKNVREIAQTGIDIISIGALTHSVTAIDFGLDMS